MKKNLLLLFLIGLLVGCAPQDNTPAIDEDPAGITTLLETYFKYGEAGDLDNFISCFDDNAMRGEPGMQLIVGKDKVKERFAELFSMADSKLSLIGEPRIEVFGDLAYSYNEITLTSKPHDGSPVIQTDMKVLTIYKRQEDGSWKIYIDNFNYHPTWSPDTIPEDLLEGGNPYY